MFSSASQPLFTPRWTALSLSLSFSLSLSLSLYIYIYICVCVLRFPFVVRVDSTSFRESEVCETTVVRVYTRYRNAARLYSTVHARTKLVPGRKGMVLLDNVYGAKGAPLLARIITWPAS